MSLPDGWDAGELARAAPLAVRVRAGGGRTPRQSSRPARPGASI